MWLIVEKLLIRQIDQQTLHCIAFLTNPPSPLLNLVPTEHIYATLCNFSQHHNHTFIIVVTVSENASVQ